VDTRGWGDLLVAGSWGSFANKLVLATRLLDLGERVSAESLFEQANALKQLDDLELFSEALSRLLVITVAAAQSAAAR